MRINLRLCHFFVFIGVLFFGCVSYLETESRDPSYTWSSFFNNDCGRTMKFTLNSEDEAILNYQCSNGKCRASLIYLGPTHATIEFPCALIRMTATCMIVSRETMGAATLIQLKPTKALITYSDGFQEFNINEKRLTPRGPFKPFKTPSPSFTHYREDNRILAGFNL